MTPERPSEVVAFVLSQLGHGASPDELADEAARRGFEAHEVKALIEQIQRLSDT